MKKRFKWLLLCLLGAAFLAAGAEGLYVRRPTLGRGHLPSAGGSNCSSGGGASHDDDLEPCNLFRVAGNLLVETSIRIIPRLRPS